MANQRLSIMTIPIAAAKRACYKDKVRAIKELKLLLPTEQIIAYLETYWPGSYYFPLPEEIPYVAALFSEALLPTRVLNRMFDMLNTSIPQFNEISLEELETAQ